MLVSDFPELLTQFKRQVHRYQDPTKKLVYDAFSHIEFLKGLNCEYFHELLYTFKEFRADEDEILLKEGDQIKSLMILIKGELEIIKHVD